MTHPELDELVAWWLDEAREEVEEHFFACAQCAQRLQWLAALGEGVRAALRAGRVGLALSAPFLAELRAAGLRLREYPLAPGESAHCTLRAEDDAVVSRMRASLGGVRRLDVLARIEVPGREAHVERLEDVPFDPASGEVLFLPSPAMLRRIPEHTARVRLVAVREAGEEPLGEYTFVHSPHHA